MSLKYEPTSEPLHISGQHLLNPLLRLQVQGGFPGIVQLKDIRCTSEYPKIFYSMQKTFIYSANGSNYRQGDPGSESTTCPRSTRGASTPSPGHEPLRDPRMRRGRYVNDTLSSTGTAVTSMYRLLKCVHATVRVPRDANRCGIHVCVWGGTLSRPYLGCKITITRRFAFPANRRGIHVCVLGGTRTTHCHVRKLLSCPYIGC